MCGGWESSPSSSRPGLLPGAVACVLHLVVPPSARRGRQKGEILFLTLVLLRCPSRFSEAVFLRFGLFASPRWRDCFRRRCACMPPRCPCRRPHASKMCCSWHVLPPERSCSYVLFSAFCMKCWYRGCFLRELIWGRGGVPQITAGRGPALGFAL